MKGRIVILYRTQKLIYTDFCGQFLTNLPHECLLRCFPSLYLPARKFPPVLPLAISSLCGEYLISLSNYRCNNFYLFHS